MNKTKGCLIANFATVPLKVSMQSNAPVPSDSIAYSAMIDAFTDKFDAPLRSGNYVAVIPWN
ncbi:hypothetical protein [Salmonella enterica]|uniref:hypothetical protein n=1 Tax=Salmonella enterica TaxID=28901 RepID=UPI0011251129|nr:hypothetical protein [Salmonella enterica]